jgi:hypothetical protein
MLPPPPALFDRIKSMKTFIRVVELWVPDRTGTRLEFGGGLGDSACSEFMALSENTLYAYNEGLAGRAWACGHPIILTEFSGPGLKRSDDAKEAGLTCGVAWPVFAGEFLMAVLILLCGGDDKRVGAIELWHNDREIAHEMSLVDGYYGAAEKFEFNSRQMRFPRGYGLPGRAWKAGIPVLIKDLQHAKQFLRWREASEIGISCGVAIPYREASDQTSNETWVLTLLSAPATPLAERFEIWVPNASRDGLVFQSGDCKRTDLDALYSAKTIGRGEGSIGGAWATGMPVICEDLKHDVSTVASLARGAGMKQIVVLPVVENALLKAVLAWYL